MFSRSGTVGPRPSLVSRGFGEVPWPWVTDGEMRTSQNLRTGEERSRASVCRKFGGSTWPGPTSPSR